MNENDQNNAVIEDTDADLEAGFAAIRGGAEPATQTQADPAQAAPAESGDQGQSTQLSDDEQHQSSQTLAPKTATDDTTQDPHADVRQLVASMIREETQALQNSLRNVAGNLGGLKSEMLREIGKLREIEKRNPEGSTAAKAAAKGQAVLLKGLRENYPELAEIIEADLSQANFAAAPAAAQFDPAEIDRRVDARVEDVKRELATDAVDLAMPDWRERIALRDQSGQPVRDSTGKFLPSREFTGWLQAKGADFNATFWNTNSPKFIVGAIREYDEARSRGTQQRQPPPPPRNKDRLIRAVVPQGRSQPVVQQEVDEEAAMQGAFNAVRGGHHL